MSKNRTDNIPLENLDKTTKSTVERQPRRNACELESNVCINRWAWALFVLGLFILCTAVLGTLLAWTPLHKDEYYPVNDITINNTDQGNIDINLIIKDKRREVSIEDGACVSSQCNMLCKHTSTLYHTILAAMSDFRCNSMHTLAVLNEVLIDNQDVNNLDQITPRVGSVILDTVTTYRPDNIFNSEFFSKVTSLRLQNCEYATASDKLLVGLKSLQSIQVYGNFFTFGNNFFEPVKNTLHYVVINAQMRIHGNLPLFGNVDVPFLIELNLNTNQIVATLTGNFLKGARQLKYLYMQNCHITNVALDFFDSFNGNLVLLDLSHNNIKNIQYIDYSVRYSNVIINLNYNDWICTCDEYRMFRKFFTDRNIVIEGPFCSTPFEMQGLCFVGLTKHCEEISSREDNNLSTTHQSIITDIFEESKTELPTTKTTSENKANLPTNTESDSKEANITLPKSEYDFALELQDNFTVKVILHSPNCSPFLNVIWFATLKSESEIYKPFFYQCSQYLSPYTLTCALEPDTTYTFCIVSNEEVGITPYNCLPFYVPPLCADDDIWIPEEYKNMTIFLIGALLISSVLFGSTIAYCTIKFCPNMLEGSKKVLLVKSEKNKSISTISQFVGKQADTRTDSQRSVSSLGGNVKKLSTCTLETQKSVSLCAFCKGDDYEVPVCSCNHPAPLPPPLPQRNSNSSSNS